MCSLINGIYAIDFAYCKKLNIPIPGKLTMAFNPALRNFTSKFRDYLIKHFSTWQELDTLLSTHDWPISLKFYKKSILKAAKELFNENEEPKDVRAFRKLVELLNDILETQFPLHSFEPNWLKYFKYLRLVFSFALFLFVTYMVIGGLLSGHGYVIKDSVSGNIALLVFLIIILGVFEGLQISITALRFTDIYALRKQFPNAFLLHGKFHKRDDVKRFFAGRQLFVIVIVFFAAQLTSLSSLTTWPGTENSFPQWFQYWLKPVLLDMGLLGALFVLWTGQLIPQFIANKRPYGFLNFFMMGLFLKLSNIVEFLGLTHPADWIEKLIKDEEQIPLSPKEKYRQIANEMQGYGIIGVKKLWEINQDTCTLNYQSKIKITRPGCSNILNTILVYGDSILPIFNSYFINYSETSFDDRKVNIIENSEEYKNGWRYFHLLIENDLGIFQPEDILSVDANIDIKNAFKDAIQIDEPTKYVLFRINFNNKPEKIGEVVVTTYIKRPTGELIQQRRRSLKLIKSDDNIHYSEFTEWYPNINTYYMFEWTYKYQ